jgi:hypothetical protein
MCLLCEGAREDYEEEYMMPKYENGQLAERIETNFKYHPPKKDQPERYDRIRSKAKELAVVFAEDAPDSRELSLALTELENAVMWANAAIARHE